MKKLLLQHWSGEIPEIVALSHLAMSAYADSIGADYVMLRGARFDERLTAPCQKLAMLSEEWDGYDDVCMVDADMFPRKGMTDDVFEIFGFGIHHPSAHARVCRHLKKWTSPTAPFWGGAIYRLPRDARRILRAHYSYEWAKVFNSRGCGEDEGIMHRLAFLAGWQHSGHPVYFSQHWAWPSYDPRPDLGNFIHVRHHNNGKPSTKMQEYGRLHAQGII